jgi:hypothetical protein
MCKLAEWRRRRRRRRRDNALTLANENEKWKIIISPSLSARHPLCID